MEIINYLIIILLGYLIGSIPFALIIGKLFYNTDIRESGSGNLGGTNAGRTLGRKVGIIVIILDISKAFLAILLAGAIVRQFNMEVNPIISGLAAVIGHCYPIFAGFRGGKGVACAAGFLLAINPLLLVIGLVMIIINLKIHQMMSLAVIITVILTSILAYLVPYFGNTKHILPFLALFLIFQHRDNIKRIIKHNENKITWI